MSDFLDFLNTAEFDVLTRVSGVTRPLAESLIEARPFGAADDCLKVRGMGKNLLARIQSAFEAGEFNAESAIVAVEEDAPPAAIEARQPAPKEESNPEEKSSFLSRLGKAFVVFLRALLRLIATLAFIAAIGAALYFGLPFLNEKLIVPVEKNTANIRSLETQVADLRSQLDAIEKTIETQTASIAKLEAMQAALEKETTAQNSSVMVALKREIMFTRAIETLSRARLYLSQSNFGFAEQDTKSAREILFALRADAPAYQIPALDQILARLDLALGNLPAFPVIAVGDVDIAWQLMMMGLPESAADVAPTPTFTFTPTPLPAFTFTPTPFLEATPTAVP
ncbi:MAG: helix-hairpin-helix domain-containing protein [Anaerolineales bacterium]|nr:helix-hairpin-helix domain-containing protein [Anaerolineales bacterium]